MLKVFSGVNEVTTFVADSTSKILTNFADSKKTAQLNLENQDVISELTTNNELLTGQNDTLQASLLQANNNATSTTNTLLPSEVILRNINDWNNQVTINVGSEDGVVVGNPVIFNGVYFGKIETVDKNSATVSLLTSENVMTNEPAMVINSAKKEINGIIRSYSSKTNTYTFESFVNNSDIKLGDPVYSNGYEGTIPSGILIGFVSNIIDTDASLGLMYEITPAADLVNARQVQVILND